MKGPSELWGCYQTIGALGVLKQEFDGLLSRIYAVLAASRTLVGAEIPYKVIKACIWPQDH